MLKQNLWDVQLSDQVNFYLKKAYFCIPLLTTKGGIFFEYEQINLMPTWTLHTEFKFDAAHFIEGYDGKCGRMHGHSYKVKMTAKSHKLNPSAFLKTDDMVCDFKELKWAAKDSEKGGFDHGNLNELMTVNTTAERIAEYIHQETKKRIPEGIELIVTVWETDTCWVEYTDQNV